eukprot:TRINITY_DN1760_c0_g2_i6.p1 TRINITY_DN1760_c0_g2~~TRINITY_DN1760_c0_g2_i6.p1  ORF type:complete len:408 (-),score=96.09 TRINITY_DN1760_c0_g2_i6:56-1279(-)
MSTEHHAQCYNDNNNRLKVTPEQAAEVLKSADHPNCSCHVLTRRGSSSKLNPLDDTRIVEVMPLIPPEILMEDVPLTDVAFATTLTARREAAAVINGTDDRLLVVVGPCSVHDPKAALDYASLLKDAIGEFKEDLCIIMRVYFEKPRTTVGWKGLINDPYLDESFKINHGLKIARTLLHSLNEMGVPCGCEYLDTITPQYISDLVSWGAIGARTTESQVHRELASGLSCPIGFKNGTDGNVQIAIDAVKASGVGHHFLSVTKHGLASIIKTAGNDSTHVILRGSNTGPNYSPEHVSRVVTELEKGGVNPRVMVDCSHGNSSKIHKNQLVVAGSIASQIMDGNTNIVGVMIESNLKEGNQKLTNAGPSALEYGKSITDACIHWDDTYAILSDLAKAVKLRREFLKRSS